MIGIKRPTATVFTAAIAGTLLAAAATGAHAQRLNYATGFPSGTIGAVAADAWAEALEEYSGGELTARVFPMSLLNFAEMSAGVRDGVADAGFVVLPYFPREFPISNMVAELSLALELDEDRDPEKDGMAYAGAMTEFIFHHCPDCVSEFQAQNQVFLGGSSSLGYELLCSREVTSVDDLRGKRLRAGGAQWSRWAEHFGASAVSLSVNETYEGLSQGVLDCTIHSATELSGFQLIDVVSDITVNLPGGVFAGSGPNNMNRELWLSLTDDQRMAVLRAASVMSAELTFRYAEEGARNMQEARERGINIHQPDAELVEASREFIRSDLMAVADRYEEHHGIEAAHEFADEFQALLDRWIALVEDVDSAETLADLYWREAFSGVEVSTYGQ
ncbi:MAG: C4-dicarboxylate TRAP transporter substrate-binding protein [Ectothiorhodospiraceae bacterium]|nr:C4-dicarboxylate TRAP transporter substrate-binding protein [Ectothiorhodospiraceae bacterium]